MLQKVLKQPLLLWKRYFRFCMRLTVCNLSSSVGSTTVVGQGLLACTTCGGLAFSDLQGFPRFIGRFPSIFGLFLYFFGAFAPIFGRFPEFLGSIVLISNRTIPINYGNEPKIYGIGWITCETSPKKYGSWPITNCINFPPYQDNPSYVWRHGLFGAWTHDGHVVKSYDLATVPRDWLATSTTMIIKPP